MTKRWTLLCAAAWLALPAAQCGAEAAQDADGRQLVAVEKFDGTNVDFDLKGADGNVPISVAGPRGFNARAFSEKGVPSIQLDRYGTVRDGLYRYEITCATDKKIDMEPGLNNGRDQAPRREVMLGASTQGHFRVEKGAIVAKDDIPEETRKGDRDDRQ